MRIISHKWCFFKKSVPCSLSFEAPIIKTHCNNKSSEKSYSEMQTSKIELLPYTWADLLVCVPSLHPLKSLTVFSLRLPKHQFGKYTYLIETHLILIIFMKKVISVLAYEITETQRG